MKRLIWDLKRAMGSMMVKELTEATGLSRVTIVRYRGRSTMPSFRSDSTLEGIVQAIALYSGQSHEEIMADLLYWREKSSPPGQSGTEG